MRDLTMEKELAIRWLIVLTCLLALFLLTTEAAEKEER
jgi:hypothetical protein